MDVNNVNSYLELLSAVMCNIKRKSRMTEMSQKNSILLFGMSASTVRHKHSPEKHYKKLSKI